MGVELGGEESEKNVCGVDLFAKDKKKGRENLKETEKGYSELGYWLLV